MGLCGKGAAWGGAGTRGPTGSLTPVPPPEGVCIHFHVPGGLGIADPQSQGEKHLFLAIASLSRAKNVPLALASSYQEACEATRLCRCGHQGRLVRPAGHTSLVG